MELAASQRVVVPSRPNLTGRMRHSATHVFLVHLGSCSTVFVLVALLLGLLFGPSRSLSAQSRLSTDSSVQNPGPALWWGFTLGAGGTRLTCDICQPARDLGPSADVAVGAYAKENLRVGVEAGGWTHDDDGQRESVYRAGVTAQLSPLVDRGLYLIGGFGWSAYRAGDFRLDAPRISVGTGWDLPVVAGWLIGSQVTLDASSLGSLKNDETTVARRVGLSTIRISIHLRGS